MNRLFVLGVAITGIGVAGYVAGVAVAYPGRAFSVTAIAVGITLVAIRNADGSNAVDGGTPTGSAARNATGGDGE